MPLVKYVVTECRAAPHGPPRCALPLQTAARAGARVGHHAVARAAGGACVLRLDCPAAGPDAEVLSPGAIGVPAEVLQALALEPGHSALELDLPGRAPADLPVATAALLELDAAASERLQCPRPQQRLFLSAFCAPASTPEPTPGDDAVACALSAAGQALCEGQCPAPGALLLLDFCGQAVALRVADLAPAGPCLITPFTAVRVRVRADDAPRPPPARSRARPATSAPGLVRALAAGDDATAADLLDGYLLFAAATWAHWRAALGAGLAGHPHRRALLDVAADVCALLTHAKYSGVNAAWRRAGDEWLHEDPVLPLPSARGALLHGLSGAGKTTAVRHVCRLLATLPLPPSSAAASGAGDAAAPAPDAASGTPDAARAPAYAPAIATFFWDVAMDFFAPGRTTTAGAGRALRAAFRDAARHAPSVVVLDNVDALQGGSGADASSRIGLLELLHQLDLLTLRGAPVFVVGIASHLPRVDRALLGEGRLEKVLELTLPTPEARTLLLDGMIPDAWTAPAPDGAAPGPRREALLASLAATTNGHLPADLRRLVCLAALERAGPPAAAGAFRAELEVGGVRVQVEGEAEPEAVVPVEEAFARAAQQLGKADGESTAAGPAAAAQYHFGDLVALDDTLALVMKHILLPLERHRELSAFGVQVPKGVLLHGPSGTGKTHLARSIQSHRLAINLNFVSVNAADIVHKVVGESEKTIKKLFQRARAASPCVLFLDQFEALAAVRARDGQNAALDRMLSTLLIEMDGVAGQGGAHVVIVAATNNKALIDPSMLRSGRLDVHVAFALPDAPQREALLAHFLRRVVSAPDVPVAAVAARTAGYSPADLQNLVQEAALAAVREHLRSAEGQAGGVGARDPHEAVRVTADHIFAALGDRA